MSTKIVTRPEELPPLADKWNALAAPFGTPLLTYEWFAACAKAATPSGQPNIVLVYSGDELSAIAPLMTTKRMGTPTLQFLGDDPLCDLCEPTGFIYRDTEALRELVDALLSLGQPLRLHRLPADSLEAELLQDQSPKCVRFSSEESRTLFVPVTTEWDQFEAGISKSRRADFRRRRKIAEKIGPVRFSVASPKPDEFTTYLERLISVERSGRKGREGTALESNPYELHFSKLYYADEARNGTLRVFLMWIGDKIAAIRFASEYAGRLWDHKIGYDEEFQRCSPGILLTHETLRYVFAQGLECHEFLGGEESWERIWTDNLRTYISFNMYPFSAQGLLGLGGQATRSVFRRSLGVLSARNSHQ